MMAMRIRSSCFLEYQYSLQLGFGGLRFGILLRAEILNQKRLGLKDEIMRWHNRHIEKINEKRTRSGFLVIPKKINDEWRWFEFAIWEQTFYQRYGKGDGIWANDYWIN